MTLLTSRSDVQSASTSAASRSWSIAATGDLLGDFIDSSDAGTLAVWDVVRSADHAFFNMEGQILRDADFEGPPASENGADNGYGGVGWGPTYEPSQAVLLAGAGFNLASHANNHSWDYEAAGMITTRRNLEKAGIHVAGSGMSLAEAQRPVFVERNAVRLALVCAAGSHTPQSVAGAGDAARFLRPRPGINALRATSVTVLNEHDFAVIKKIAAAQGQDPVRLADEVTLYNGQHPLCWSRWRQGEAGAPPSISWDINAAALDGIRRSIQEAKQSADGVIFSFHAHESESGASDGMVPMPLASTVPAAYAVVTGKTAIDAGASAVFMHGPHHLRGIEIYRGRPIFYGIGHLTYSLGRSFRGHDLPIEWDDGLVASVRFREGMLSEITVHPLVHAQMDAGAEKSREQAMPKIAPVAPARRILEHLRKVSSPFGTVIEIKESADTCVGVVRLRPVDFST